VPSVVGDLPEAIGPVVTAPRENLHRFVGEVDLHPVAIELDFMDPSLAGRHAVDRGRQGRLDEAGEGRLDAQRFRLFSLEGHRYTRRRLNCCRSCGE
jgi:hypothetical protein